MVPDPEVEWLRAKMEQLVRASNERASGPDRLAELLGIFLANVPDFIALVATDGTILSLNRAGPGHSPADVVGHSVFEYFPENPGAGMRATLERVVATAETISFESSARYGDGTEVHLLTRIAPVLSEGRVMALALIATDVSARARAEAALRESEEKLRITVGATGMGLWSWHVRDDAILWDEAMQRMWGVAEATVPRDRGAYLALIHPDDRALLRQRIAQVLETGDYPSFEHRIVRPDGVVRRILAKGSVIRAADGTVERLIGGCLDVTEQRENEERARQTQKLEAIGQLSAGVAHNFNNLLMAIMPNIELAMVGAAPEALPMLRSAHDASLRAAELVRQLMTFAGRTRPKPKKEEDVCLLVQRTVAMCRSAFDARVELSLRLCCASARVVGDIVQLEQVLLNLLINARDAVAEASVPSKRIAVDVRTFTANSREHTALGLEADQTYVCIRVSDNGVGMEPAVHERIYEPFFTTKEVGKGTGLGLSTARAIVQDHRGVLHSSSELGVGSTFSVILPAHAAVAPHTGPVAPSQEERGGERLLVVDDEPAVRDVVRRMLEKAGYTVDVASSGAEALALLSQIDVRRQLALVLVDLSMPGMSGDVLRAHLRELDPALKVAYLSGHALDNCGDVAGVIEKPATYAALARRVREILDRAE